MELFSELLVGMRLYAQGLVDGQNLEQEWQLVLIALSNVCREQSLVVLDQVEECSFCLEVLGGKRGVSAHP